MMHTTVSTAINRDVDSRINFECHSILSSNQYKLKIKVKKEKIDENKKLGLIKKKMLIKILKIKGWFIFIKF